MPTGAQLNERTRRIELKLATYLGLPLDEVEAGSFEVLESGTVRWWQVQDGRRFQGTVKLDAATVRALVDQATADLTIDLTQPDSLIGTMREGTRIRVVVPGQPDAHFVVREPPELDDDGTWSLPVEAVEKGVGHVCQPCHAGEHWRCSEPGVCECTEPVDTPTSGPGG